MANYEFKKDMKKSGIRMWQVADKLGICEVSLSRKFRYELSIEEKDTIRKIITEIQKDPAYKKQSISEIYQLNQEV